MKTFLITLLIFVLSFPLFSCREKKFKEAREKRAEQRSERLKYISIYNVNFNTSKGGKYYYVDITFYANNNTNDKKIYWFQVLVDIYSGGKLSHSIIYTPNYYKGKNSNIKYYHTLEPGQTGEFRIILGESYKITEKPDYVKIKPFDVGDNIDIFKKIRVNPEKYFIPYTPGG